MGGGVAEVEGRLRRESLSWESLSKLKSFFRWWSLMEDLIVLKMQLTTPNQNLA